MKRHQNIRTSWRTQNPLKPTAPRPTQFWQHCQKFRSFFHNASLQPALASTKRESTLVLQGIKNEELPRLWEPILRPQKESCRSVSGKVCASIKIWNIEWILQYGFLHVVKQKKRQLRVDAPPRTPCPVAQRIGASLSQVHLSCSISEWLARPPPHWPPTARTLRMPFPVAGVRRKWRCPTTLHAPVNVPCMRLACSMSRCMSLVPLHAPLMRLAFPFHDYCMPAVSPLTPCWLLFCTHKIPLCFMPFGARRSIAKALWGCRRFFDVSLHVHVLQDPTLKSFSCKSCQEADTFDFLVSVTLRCSDGL